MIQGNDSFLAYCLPPQEAKTTITHLMHQPKKHIYVQIRQKQKYKATMNNLCEI